MEETKEQSSGLWFRAKRFGWGWQPSSWQGWGILFMYMFSVLSEALFVNMHVHSGTEFVIGFFPRIYILTVFLVIICYRTGEHPKWRWGLPKKEKTDGAPKN